MSSVYEEPKSWPLEGDGESDEAELTVEKLRKEIAAARQRLDDHRSQLKAIGLETPEASNDPDAPDQDSGASA